VNALNNTSSKAQDITIVIAVHIETLHHCLHVLTGGIISSSISAPGRVNELRPDNVLLYFNLFKGLSDGRLSKEDFGPENGDYAKIRTSQALIDGESEIVKKIITKQSFAIETEGENFEEYRKQIASESNNYIQTAFEWMNKLVISGEIDATGYINKIIETKILTESENFDESTLSSAQKIYLISNTKTLLEEKGLESFTLPGIHLKVGNSVD
jgi:hypothetical protein